MEIANEKKIAGLVQFLRKGRTMTGRFRLPMLEEQAYEYLLAAYIMEVQLRYRRFIYNGFVEEQLKQVANCLTANTAKFGIVLCGGCGNGKTTMLKALQNLVRRLEILKPNLSPNAGHSSDNYYNFTIVNAMQIVKCRTTAISFIPSRNSWLCGMTHNCSRSSPQTLSPRKSVSDMVTELPTDSMR